MFDQAVILFNLILFLQEWNKADATQIVRIALKTFKDPFENLHSLIQQNICSKFQSQSEKKNIFNSYGLRTVFVSASKQQFKNKTTRNNIQ